MENPANRNERKGRSDSSSLDFIDEGGELTEVSEKGRRDENDLELLRSEEEDLRIDFGEPERKRERTDQLSFVAS